MVLMGASEQRSHLEAADGWLQQLIPHVLPTMEKGHCSPFTVLQFIIALVRCPGPEATEALDKCTELMTVRMQSIPAASLVSLSQSLCARPGWFPPDALLER